MKNHPTSRMRLGDALAELRAEISSARQEGQGKDVRFAATAIEVELSIEFGWAAEASGGSSKWIPFVDLSAQGGADGRSMHKITLSLEIDTGGDPSKRLIADETGPAPVTKPKP